MADKDVKPTKVVTDKVRFSYLHVFEPTAINAQSEAKYSVSLIIPKKNKALIAKITTAVNAAKELGKEKWGGKIPANLKMPLRDGDIDRPEDEAYKGAMFVNATCKTKPGLVDQDLNPIMSQDDLKSGDYGRASVNFYPFNTSGSKGIACGLNNLQKLEDGEALSGRPSAQDDFGDGTEASDSEDDLL